MMMEVILRLTPGIQDDSYAKYFRKRRVAEANMGFGSIKKVSVEFGGAVDSSHKFNNYPMLFKITSNPIKRYPDKGNPGGSAVKVAQ